MATAGACENTVRSCQRQRIFRCTSNFVLGLYPDSVIYYQEVPQSATQTVQRGMCYRRREESREMKAARYLSGRIEGDCIGDRVTKTTAE